MESLFWNCRISFLLLHKWHKFTFSTTSASAGSCASRIVRSVQHLFLSWWWLQGGHNCPIHKPVLHRAHDSSATHPGWWEFIRQQKSNALLEKQKPLRDFTSNLSGSRADVPGHKTATMNWLVWYYQTALWAAKGSILTQGILSLWVSCEHIMASQGVCPYWSQKDIRILKLILLKAYTLLICTK